LKAVGARQAFAVSSHADSPLSEFVLKNIDIEGADSGDDSECGSVEF